MMDTERSKWKGLWVFVVAVIFLFVSSIPAMAQQEVKPTTKCRLWNYFFNPNRFGKPKRTLKGNMMEIYNVLPEEATNPLEIFTKGVWYGRLRINYFKWLWDEGRYYGKAWDYQRQRWTKKGWHDRIDPTGFGFGGSIIYKTAPYYGFSATVGFYGDHDLHVLDEDDALFGKSGKDTFSRFDVMEHGNWGMAVVAQAYLEYKFRKNDIRIGRMIVECPFIHSNDTKMIPNTMRGVHFVTKEIPHTKLQLMYFDRQKLRDHTKFHDVITYMAKGVSPFRKWDNQDDSAVHKGLSYDNFDNYGLHTRNRLFIVGLTTKGLPFLNIPALGPSKLKIDLWNAWVPDLFDTFLGEANYKINLGGGWKLIPGFRFMHQFDDEAGDVGGAALSGVFGYNPKGLANRKKGLGYKDPDSVDATEYAFRLRLKKGPQMFHFGMTYITDDSDFIAPWRAWPTQGYTRSMAQYNWEAGTKSYMLKWVMDWNKAHLIKGFKSALDITYMDYDDEKERLGSMSKTDRYIIHLDTWWTPPIKLPKDQWLQCKFRLGYVQADHRRYAPANGENPSYTELRFEINYMF